ncbi:TM2 domain-containing protein [Lentibacillus amyloliquefaciens]|uniref:TM2 domain-containing protein n=1 Tax=Lentibacillus amyloliquefaciens TaxID=1472767 RepID=A0A0U3WBN2_9BACI|nr:TM2 domain-containing protein [Lentibacillus amyloliquefaciens]ALX50432.1 hypothetical protein AOX59_18715 [Lentibacillus amyloliquefaciens]
MQNIQAKQSMSTEELAVLEGEFEEAKKPKWVTYTLWFFLGGIGGHRFYVGDTGYAIAMLFLNWATFGIWSLIDVFLIGKRLRKKNAEIEMGLINKIKLFNRGA